MLQDTGEWNGLIRELIDERADMIMTAFTINQIRSSVIDFSVPFLESGITIMVSIRKGAISPYAFLGMHYANTPMQCAALFKFFKNDIFKI